MKNAVLFLFLLAGIFAVQAQNGADCGMYGKKTVAQRNKLFPFNKATKVLLISYGNYELLPEDDTVARPVGINKWVVKREGYNDRVYNTIEEVELAGSDLNRLSDILVNFTLKDKNAENLLSSVNLCYFPRNSVLFLNSEGEVICNYELCFECDRFVLSPDPQNLTQFDDVHGCIDKLYLVKEIFKKNGIKYGLDEQ